MAQVLTERHAVGFGLDREGQDCHHHRKHAARTQSRGRGQVGYEIANQRL